MARPKKVTEPIVGAGKDPELKLTVQKSIPLFSLWRSDMSLAEFKILDTYLSRINSRQPEKRTVVFTKGELEGLLGVSKINKADLVQRLKGLGRFVEVEDSDHRLRNVALFEEAYGEADENGLWTVQLTCTAKAMKYIFNVEQLGYLRYKLRCITSLTSRYTYVLFMYLEANRFRKTWTVNVAELRHILNCEEEFYDEFKYFNQRILLRCQKELHDKTECRFAYRTIRSGKKVKAIRFEVATLADEIEQQELSPQLPGQFGLDDYTEDDPLAIYREALPDGFTDEEIRVLVALAKAKVFWVPGGPIPRECAIADYLRHKVLLMNATKTNKARPYGYLRTMIEKDEDVY